MLVVHIQNLVLCFLSSKIRGRRYWAGTAVLSQELAIKAKSYQFFSISLRRAGIVNFFFLFLRPIHFVCQYSVRAQKAVIIRAVHSASAFAMIYCSSLSHHSKRWSTTRMKAGSATGLKPTAKYWWHLTKFYGTSRFFLFCFTFLMALQCNVLVELHLSQRNIPFGPYKISVTYYAARIINKEKLVLQRGNDNIN